VKILDIGCGNTKAKGAIGIDLDPKSDADYNIDFDDPLPFRQAEFDKVLLSHALEHSRNFGKLLAEADRLTKQNGVIEIMLPLKSSWGYYFHKHNYFFEFEGRFGRTCLPLCLQRFLGKFMPNEMIMRIRKRTKRTKNVYHGDASE
jgi:SAM-dependent methyltransferase